MPQFLIHPGKKVGDVVTLSLEESHHLVKVLRQRAGDVLRLADGAGALFQGRIEVLSHRGTTARIESVVPIKALAGRVTLAQGLLKGEKMEFVIQKAAELGAETLLPFTSSRTVAEWKNDPRKLQRWRKIGEAASKQSGRAAHLDIREPVGFETILKTAADERIVFWEEAGTSVRDFFQRKKPENVLILIGPEGGFSRQEADQAAANGFALLSMGSLILRAETAAVAALSVIQYELGNL
jgi:16S rRNA (uracil1498-N3)-methyltransferase